MISGLYIEINVICVCILGMLISVVWRGVVRESEQRIFSNLCVNALLLFFFDILWCACNGGQFTGAYVLNNLVNAAYFIQMGVLGYFWLRYAMFIDGYVLHNKVERVAVAIPLILIIIMSVISLWTNSIFWVDYDNCYHRGPFLWVHNFLASLYLFLPFFFGLLHSVFKKNYPKKNKLLAMSFFGLLPLLGGISQNMTQGLSIFCVSVTIGLIVMFVENQEHLISVDPLTRLNNRVQLNRFLDSKISAFNSNKKLVVFIMDLDFFKSINDKFGHMEGDRALLAVAAALKSVFGPKGHFISRFGGDEFVAVAELNDLVEIYELKSEFNRVLAQKSKDLPFEVSVSMGFAEREVSDNNIPDLFNRADAALYEAKNKRRKSR